MNAPVSNRNHPALHGVREMNFEFRDHWFILRSAPRPHGQKMLADGLKEMGLDPYFPQLIVSRRCGRSGMRTEPHPYLKGYIPVKLRERGDKEIIERLPGFLQFMRPPGSVERFYTLTPAGMSLLSRYAGQVIAKSEKREVPFQIGDYAKVVDGPFSEHGGVVIDKDDKNQRLTLELPIFGRSTPVRFELWQVEGRED